MDKSNHLSESLQVIEHILRDCGRVIVAFSGGVDSTLVAKLARDVLGKANVLAATADSPSLARADLNEAIRLAKSLDIRHVVVATHELSNPAYQANLGMRCYHCKHGLFTELDELARRGKFSMVLYGAIWDDMLDYRPGERAAAEHGVRAPLQEAGFSKLEVRELAKSLGLPNWNLPQNACLASRIPYGSSVTLEKLAQIEQAEAAVRAHGFRQVRVRNENSRARIEVGVDELNRLESITLRLQLKMALRECGFSDIEFDPRGYLSPQAQRESLDKETL